MSDTTTLSPPAFTAADRCDRCGAQAYVRATLPGGGELMFCAHHGKQYADRLKQLDADLLDESHTIS